MTIEHFHAAIVIVKTNFGSQSNPKDWTLLLNSSLFATIPYIYGKGVLWKLAANYNTVHSIGIMATCTRSNYVKRNDNVNENGKEQEKKNEKKHIPLSPVCVSRFRDSLPSLAARCSAKLLAIIRISAQVTICCNDAATKHKINTEKTAFIFSFWPFLHPRSTELSNSKRKINVLSYRANKRWRRVQMPRTHAQKHKSSNHLNNKEIE